MTIIRWSPRQFELRSPFRELERLRNQVENLFDSFTGSSEGRGVRRMGVYPLLNLTEDSDSLYVTAELPGVNPVDLELSIEQDKLILRGERKITEAGENVNYHRRERDAGFFRRVVSLPVKVDTNRVTAATKNGILTVTLPKAEEVKPRQIKIESV